MEIAKELPPGGWYFVGEAAERIGAPSRTVYDWVSEQSILHRRRMYGPRERIQVYVTDTGDPVVTVSVD